jgi:hypothetical protein
MGDGSAWFAVPCELLPAPPIIVGRAVADPRRARRPPALAVAQPVVVAKKPKPSSKTESMDGGGLVLPDRALDLPDAMHLRHGRYLKNGKVVAVPQLVKDWEEDLQDENNELLVVDLSTPGGAWFEDPEVSSIRVETEEGGKLLPIGLVRDHVRSRVNLFARPVASLRKLNVPCRLPRLPLHVIVLVSLCDMSELLREAESA